MTFQERESLQPEHVKDAASQTFSTLGHQRQDRKGSNGAALGVQHGHLGFLDLVCGLRASSRGARWKSDDGACFGGRGYLAAQEYSL
jgi:hypothetical protein